MRFHWHLHGPAAAFAVCLAAFYVMSCGKTTLTAPEPTRASDPLVAIASCERPTRVADSGLNHGFAEATPLGVCALASGSVGGHPDRRADFYKITIPAGHDGMLSLSALEHRANWRPLLALYNHERQKRGEAAPASGTETPFTWRVRATAGETYYAMIEDDVPDNQRTDYQLLADFEAVADPNEPNNNFATATALTAGKAVPLAFFAGSESAADDDYFKIALPVGRSRLVVDFTNKGEPTAPITPFLVVYDGQQKLLDYQTSNAGGHVRLALEGLAPGTYYLKLHAGAGEHATALHRLTVTTP